jgi:pimeloyl-ACP methyl ester carboxylesterase
VSGSRQVASGWSATICAELLGNDPEQARATAARIWDRTPSGEPSVQQASQLGMVFARLDCTLRWRQRLGELTLPTLVVHGRGDPFFPVGNGEALAGAIPAARLLVLDDMGTALRDAAADEVTAAMLALSLRRRAGPQLSAPYDSLTWTSATGGFAGGRCTLYRRTGRDIEADRDLIRAEIPRGSSYE